MIQAGWKERIDLRDGILRKIRHPMAEARLHAPRSSHRHYLWNRARGAARDARESITFTQAAAWRWATSSMLDIAYLQQAAWQLKRLESALRRSP